MDRIYCYSGSNVLRNKMKIRDREKLQQVERQLTMLRILELIDKPIYGNFDLQHLKQINWYIFQDIYSWAGEIRKVDIAKGNMFCNVRFIEEQATEIFGKLKKEKYLQGLEEKEAAKRMAYYFSEINALHPFREGNGRSQREFIRILALHIGYKINFAKVSKEEMIKASEESFLCDYKKMEALFVKVIEKNKIWD